MQVFHKHSKSEINMNVCKDCELASLLKPNDWEKNKEWKDEVLIAHSKCLFFVAAVLQYLLYIGFNQFDKLNTSFR